MNGPTTRLKSSRLAMAFVLVASLTLGVAMPALAITGFNPGSATIEAGESIEFRATGVGLGSCVSATSPHVSLTVTVVSGACTTSPTIRVSSTMDTPPNTYGVVVEESILKVLGIRLVLGSKTFSLTVTAPPPPTTTTAPTTTTTVPPTTSTTATTSTTMATTTTTTTRPTDGPTTTTRPQTSTSTTSTSIPTTSTSSPSTSTTSTTIFDRQSTTTTSLPSPTTTTPAAGPPPPDGPAGEGPVTENPPLDPTDDPILTPVAPVNIPRGVTANLNPGLAPSAEILAAPSPGLPGPFGGFTVRFGLKAEDLSIELAANLLLGALLALISVRKFDRSAD